MWMLTVRFDGHRNELDYYSVRDLVQEAAGCNRDRSNMFLGEGWSPEKGHYMEFAFPTEDRAMTAAAAICMAGERFTAEEPWFDPEGRDNYR
jgi:hypothetical protein